jgi:hypothetical protein
MYAKNKDAIKMKLSYSIIAFICVIGFSFINKVDMAYNIYTNILLFIISSICGTYFILFISEKIKQNSILEFIGKKSLPIMLFHFLSFLIVNGIIVYVYDLPINRILDYPTIKDYKWWWLLFLFIGIFVSILIDEIILFLKSFFPSYFTVNYWFKKINKKYNLCLYLL